jgi:2Fe-2S ferredoxin
MDRTIEIHSIIHFPLDEINSGSVLSAPVKVAARLWSAVRLIHCALSVWEDGKLPKGQDARENTMPNLTVIDRTGAERAVAGEPGLSVMEIIRGNGFDELLALCGGCCSCATCHVYVDVSFYKALPAMTDDEDDLLSSSDHREVNSRLACQIVFGQELDGLIVKIAPDD